MKTGLVPVPGDGDKPEELIMKANRQLGNGKIGCLIWILALAALVFLIIRVSPVYVAKINFQDDLDKITSKAGANGWSERMIRAEVKKLAEDLEFDVSSDDIQVVRRSRFEQAARVTVIVKISRPVSVPGFYHVFEFECESSGLIGTL